MRVVIKIFMMHEEGHSNRAIAKQLSAWGVPTKTGKNSKWSHQTVSSVIHNRDFYQRFLDKN